MKDFFKPWRRKIGVVTMVMACVLMAGWVRSIGQSHVVQFPLGRQIAQTIEFTMGMIIFHQDVNPQITTVAFNSMRLPDSATFVWKSHPRGKWHWRICGLGEYEDLQSNGKTRKLYVAHYPSIVVPLTLLSGYLLLRKPRPAKNPEAAQSAGVNDG